MSRFIDYRNPLSPVELEIARLGREERVRNYTTPQYILGDGSASFSPPSSNAFTNLFQKSARNSIDLGTGAGAALNSGAGVLSRQFYQLSDDTIPLYEREGSAILSDGTVKPVQDLSGTDYFNALNPTMRVILEQNGVSESNFKDVGSIEEASERYNNIQRGLFLDQSLRQYNAENPNWASVTGILNFGLDAVTDPINLISFGFGGLAKGSASATGKAVVSETMERSLAIVGKNMIDGDSFATAMVRSGRDGDYLAAQIVDAINPSGFVTREVVDVDGKVYTVTSKIISTEGDTVRLQPIRIEGEGLVRRKSKGLPQGPGTELMPVTVSQLNDTTGLAIRKSRELPPGSGPVLTARASAGRLPPGSSGVSIADDVSEAAAGRILSRGSAISGAVAGGVTFDALSQYAEYIHRTENLGIEEEFNYNYLRGGMSAILTGGLAAIGSIDFGSRPKALTNTDLINHSPASVAGYRAANKVRNGTASGDAKLRLIELDALNRADKWSKAAYTPDQYAEIMDILKHAPLVDGPAKGPNEISVHDVGAIFNNAPTFAEAKSFLLDGAKGPVDTAFNKVLTELKSVTEQLRVAKSKSDADLEKKLRKRYKKLEEDRRILTDTFEFREDTDGYRYRAIVDDVPLLDIYHMKDDRMNRLRDLMALRMEDLPGSTQGNLKKATTQVFDFLAQLGSQGVVARQYQKMVNISDNPVAQNVARMIGAIDSRIANDFYTTPDGKAVLTVEQNIALFSLKRTNFVNTYYRVMKKKTRVEREAIGREVMQARSGTIDKDSISESAKEILPLFSKYYDEMAEIGVRNGSLRSRIDDYINIQFKDGVTNAQYDSVAKKLAKYWREEEFGDTSDSLHFGTLIRVKVLDLDGNPINAERYAKRPRRKSDLTPEDMKHYEEGLEAALLKEARDAVAHRQGRTKGGPEDPIARNENRKIQFRTENRASRAIEQKFWMSEDIMNMGIIDTEVSEVMKSYERSMGAYMARQETMTDLFGEAVRFKDVVELLRGEARKISNDDPIRQDILDAVDALENMGARVLGHRTRKATGLEKILQPFLDVASGAIRQGVIIPMSTEVSVVGLSSLIRPSEARLMIKHLRETFNITAVREDLMAAGYAIDYERANDRFFGTSPFEPANSVGKGARWFKENSTIWFGEEALTNRLRRFSFAAFHMRTGRKLMSIVDKLENLDVKLDPNDPASLKAAARASGFGGDAAFAREVRRLGLSTKKSRDAIRRFKEVDPDSLNHPTTATRIAMQETDEALQRSMLEVSDAIGILARERTDRFVVKRSSGTEFRDNDTLGTALLQFLTYPTSWFNAYLKRGVQGPNHQLAGYMGAYILGEVTASILRDIVYKGKTPDEVLDEWEEDFLKKVGRIVQRIPVAGPWTDFAVSPAVSLLTGERPRFSLATTPAGSFAEKTMGSSISILRKWANGEPVNNQEIKNATRMVPILGSPPAQYLLGQGAEE